MFQTAITSILAFASTNIDDIFLLTLFYGGGKYKSSEIIAGQYLGVATLVLIGIVGSFIGSFIDQRYIGFLGLFPIYLAIKQVIELLKGGNNGEDKVNMSSKSLSIFAIAGVTIANGGDNIGVYIPLLITFDTQEKILLVTIFVLMIYLWCIIAKHLAHHPFLAKSLSKYGHIIMPVVLLLLGAFIIYESGSFTLFFTAVATSSNLSLLVFSVLH